MLITSTILTYPIAVLLSIGKKSFENIGKIIKASGRIVASTLQPAKNSFSAARNICQKVFVQSKTVYLIIDDTLIRKIFATNMRGSGMFFDTKLGRCINAFRLVTAMISDGKYTIPIDCSYLFSKEILDLCSEKYPSKEDIVKSFVEAAYKIFPDKNIVVVADGLYATVELLNWCSINKIKLEVRMHSNRIVMYKGIKIKLSELAELRGVKFTGRQTARTVTLEWHGIPLELTIVKRTDKKGRESIVFQAATYKAEPREHVKTYKIRWNTEMAYRTCKQTLGLGDCFSKDLDVQHNHAAATFLSYAIAQCEMQKQRLKTPEETLRALKEEFSKDKFNQIIERFDALSVFDA